MSGTDCAKSIPKIDKEMVELTESINNLENAVKSINERFSTILSPELTTPEDEKKDIEIFPILAKEIAIQSRRIRRLTSFLFEIRDRCEL